MLIQIEVHRRHPDDQLLGLHLEEKYRIFDVLGRGAFGMVYKALQDPFERTVAVKTIRPEAASKYDAEGLKQRFVEEARVISRLNHDHIVTLYDFSHHNDVFFMVLEYVEGRTLRHVLQLEGRQTPTQAVEWLGEALEGLEEAHKADILHLDLKPENLMVTPQRAGLYRLKILDFGVAQLMGALGGKPLLSQQTTVDGGQAREVLGTPKYMAPEQAQGRPLRPETDLYAVGVILFEMLEGRPPYDARSSYRLMEQHVQWPVPELTQPDIPEALRAVVRRAMSKDPRARFNRATEMAAAMRAAVGLVDGRGSASEPLVPYTPLPHHGVVESSGALDPIPVASVEQGEGGRLLLNLPKDEGALSMRSDPKPDDPDSFFSASRTPGPRPTREGTPAPRRPGAAQSARFSRAAPQAPGQKATSGVLKLAIAVGVLVAGLIAWSQYRARFAPEAPDPAEPEGAETPTAPVEESLLDKEDP